MSEPKRKFLFFVVVFVVFLFMIGVCSDPENEDTELSKKQQVEEVIDRWVPPLPPQKLKDNTPDSLKYEDFEFCVNSYTDELKKLGSKIAESAIALDQLQRADNCFEREPEVLNFHPKKTERYRRMIKKLKNKLAIHLVPKEKDFVISNAFWTELDENPTVNEDLVASKIANKFRISVEKLDKITVRVLVYKEWLGNSFKETLKKKLTINGSLKNLVYEPTQNVIVVQFNVRFGLTENSVRDSISEDLIRTVGSSFKLSPSIQVVQVSAFAKSLDGGGKNQAYTRVASVVTDRKEYKKLGPAFFKRADCKEIYRLNPSLTSATR